MKLCVFCETEATHIIEQTDTPVCQSCKIVYGCGQASPDSTFEEITNN